MLVRLEHPERLYCYAPHYVERAHISQLGLELFSKWKKGKKAVKKGNKEIDLVLSSSEKISASGSELLLMVANTFSTQLENLPNTIKRFLKDLEGFKKKLE